MRSRKRLLAALALALVCLPGNLLKSDPPTGFPEDVAITRLSGAAKTDSAAWRVEGIWKLSSQHADFGGFSALIPLGEDRLRAFSDRGNRLTFGNPDTSAAQAYPPAVARQLVMPRYAVDLWDIESATIDPVTGSYWLGFEYVHALHRYSVSSEPEAVLIIDADVDWNINAGAEAFERLTDGRFMLIPEDSDEVWLYPSHPVAGAPAEILAFASPPPGYAVTRLAQLPDGRVLLLMRKVAVGFPPFDTLIAIGEPPASGEGAPWSPAIAVRLEGHVPRENYEGMTVRAAPDGRIAVWIISDDNFSVIQRSLLVKLRFDPASTGA